MDSGELTYTKVREFVNLVTPEDEEEWIEFAKTHTNREIELYVRRKERAAGTETTTVVSVLTPEEKQAERKAREVLTKKTGKSIPPAKLHAEMAKVIASGGLFDDSNGKPKKSTAYVSFQPCPICLETFVPVPEGILRVPAGEWIKAMKDGAEVFDLMDHFYCDCEGEKHRKDQCKNWKLPEAEAPKNRHIPVETEKRINARDGLVCRTPDCGCEGPLENSHLQPYCEGTPPLLELIRKHCASCNDMIETGALRVVGYAPFDRYYNADNDFLGWGYFRRNSHVGTRPQDPRMGERGPPEGGLKGSETS
jgi:deoxycytidylate deaminase